MPETSAEAYALITALKPRQRDVLGCIAMNDDGGHHPRTLQVLEAKELIESYSDILPGRFSVKVTRYRVPIHVHLAYCQWASEHEHDEC